MDAPEGFIQYLLHEKGLKEVSLKFYLYIFKYFPPEFFSITRYREAAEKIVEVKVKRNWCDRMTYKVASMCAVYFNWAAREGLIAESPMRLGHSFKKHETKQADFFDWDSTEFKKIIYHPNLSMRMSAILHVLRSSGIRRSELCNLRIEDLNDRWLVIREGKGDRQRFAPIDQETREVLDRYLKSLEACGYSLPWLFPKDDLSGPMKPESLWKWCYKFGKRLGIRITPHKFRHSLGGHLIQRGADITVVADVLGHKSFSSTKIYVHHKKEKLIEQYDKFA